MRRLALSFSLLASLALGAGASLVAIQTAAAQDSLRRVPLRPLTPGLIRTANSVPFDPDTQGFLFINNFSNNLVSAVDFRTDGLCGGMVFAVLDYLNNPSIPMPTQDFQPAEGTPLRNYLLQRQMDSMGDRNLTRWVEQFINPFGARNDEFWRWGLEDRLTELRRRIDAGERVPVALKGCDEGCKGDHVVLVVGYSVGTYLGDPGRNADQVRFTVYDPNYPGRLKTLYTDPVGRFYRYSDDGARGDKWRTWFPMQYSPRRPPRIDVSLERQVIMTFKTGGDDLRGGNDNVNVLLLLPDRRTLRFDNVNQGYRWVNNSTHSVAVTLPPDVAASDLRGIQLETTFGGGTGGDNWNLDNIQVETREGSGSLRLRYDHWAVNGGRTVTTRFTGEDRTETFLF